MLRETILIEIDITFNIWLLCVNAVMTKAYANHSC